MLKELRVQKQPNCGCYMTVRKYGGAYGPFQV